MRVSGADNVVSGGASMSPGAGEPMDEVSKSLQKQKMPSLVQQPKDRQKEKQTNIYEEIETHRERQREKQKFRETERKIET